MIEVRNYRAGDGEALELIPHDGIPGLRNLFTNVTAIDDDNRVRGYGSINLFAECFMLLDPTLSKREKASAFIKILQIGILRSRDAGLEQLYLISNSPEFSHVLRNKYGFKAVPGELLMLDLTEDKDGEQESKED